MSIPRIIYQTCADRGALPAEIAANVDALKETNPGWAHRLYEDKDIFRFIRDNYGESVHRCARRINPKYGVVLADLFRYLAVYKTGGVYLDIKSSIESPLDNFLRATDSFILSQWRNRFAEEFQGWGLHPEIRGFPGGEFQQWHVIAAPGHPFLRSVIRRVMFNIENYDPKVHGTGAYGVLRLSGPVCYTLAILPQLRKHPFRVVDVGNFGLRYSIYRDMKSDKHPWKDPRHYRNQVEPIVLPKQPGPRMRFPPRAAD